MPPPPSSYEKLKMLGKGAFGSVFLVQSIQGGEPLVMKEVSLRGLSRKERQTTLNEVDILKKVVHPNVIAYRDSFSTIDVLCICMEHAPGGDLTALIGSKRQSRSRFTEAAVVKMAYELTSALSYLHHELHLLHRDLKPQNVFVGSDGSMKLGDFGLSKQLAATNALAKTLCGTPLYMSPELCAGKTYNRAADVWALGCVLFEAMSLQAPWQQYASMGINALLQLIARTGTLDLRGVKKHYSRALCEFLERLLAKSATQRPALSTLLPLPLFEHLHAAAAPGLHASPPPCTATAASTPSGMPCAPPAAAPPAAAAAVAAAAAASVSVTALA
eukprot:CAMPEP_0119076592 /NCGR_PEP_ID=MMETSP1178-20130426/88193_1 /TAXON_ID=33656 /ORGANISM="unid sp, Strain CCMP2000" /LENGTH=330 /DNA_ID=CAMNT_0007058887 /DNA_START=41 /DNA_END=1029 /DNA_ORIENTATION=+